MDSEWPAKENKYKSAVIYSLDMQNILSCLRATSWASSCLNWQSPLLWNISNGCSSYYLLITGWIKDCSKKIKQMSLWWMSTTLLSSLRWPLQTRVRGRSPIKINKMIEINSGHLCSSYWVLPRESRAAVREKPDLSNSSQWNHWISQRLASNIKCQMSNILRVSKCWICPVATNCAKMTHLNCVQ